MSDALVLPPLAVPKRSLPDALKANLWSKGQSGNPNGKSGLYQQCQKLAREHSPQAIEKLVELMNCDDPRVQTVAANSILDRAWGKPKEYDPRAEEPEAMPIDPSQFTPKQRAMVRRVLELLLSAETASASDT